MNDHDADEQSGETSERINSKRQRTPVAEADRRTLFLTGFPSDVTDREVNCLFAFAPGYIKCMKQTKDGGTVNVFALFENHMAALSAVDVMSGYSFGGAPLRSQLAKANLHHRHQEDGPRVPWGTTAGAGVYLGASGLPQSSLFGAGSLGAGVSGLGGSLSTPAAAAAAGMGGLQAQGALLGSSLWASPWSSYQAQDSWGQPQYQPQPMLAMSQNSGARSMGHGGGGGGRAESGGSSGSTNPPCDTLFLRNIGVNQSQLRATMQSLGSTNVKMMGSGGSAAFVQFPNAEYAAAALPNIQGVVCSSCEYAKNPLGKRSRD